MDATEYLWCRAQIAYILLWSSDTVIKTNIYWRDYLWYSRGTWCKIPNEFQLWFANEMNCVFAYILNCRAAGHVNCWNGILYLAKVVFYCIGIFPMTFERCSRISWEKKLLINLINLQRIRIYSFVLFFFFLTWLTLSEKRNRWCQPNTASAEHPFARENKKLSPITHFSFKIGMWA